LHQARRETRQSFPPDDRGHALRAPDWMLHPVRTGRERTMTRRLAFDRTMRIAACFGAVLAAGCGGDDDSPPPPELLQITATNQVAVARATAVSLASLDSVRDVPTANSAGAPTASDATASTKHALGKAIAVARAVPLATISTTEQCPLSGSIAITLDDRDNSTTLSAGDVLSATFNECRDSPSSVIRGSFSANIASYSDPLLSGLFTFSQLTIVDEAGSAAFNGQANLAYNLSTDPTGASTTRITMTVPAAGLVGSLSVPGYSDTFTYDPNFSAVWTDVTPSSAPGYSTAVLNGKVNFASLSGKILASTDPPVHDVWAEDYPDRGKVLITGYQSKLQMTVLNTTTVRLELDANNDGTFESTRDIPWTELLPF
jgi:hypothetical protein